MEAFGGLAWHLLFFQPKGDLPMTDKLTRKSIEALEGARKLALRRNHQAVGVPHLLAALLEQTDGLVLQLIRKSGASVDALRAGAERLLDRIPSVSGPGARQEADKYYVTNELQKLLDDAEERGVIPGGVTSRDLLDSQLMGVLTPRPSQVIEKFWYQYKISPMVATQWYYDFSRYTDYIRSYRVIKDMKWVSNTRYGDIDITISPSRRRTPGP